MHENRETSGAPRPKRERGRSAKVQNHTADTHTPEESDRAILSMNQTNKEERSSAEPGEKRAWAKENIVQSDTSPTQRGEVSVPRIARCASSSIARQSSKVGAVCGNAARTVLCGGRSAMVVPTATTTFPQLKFASAIRTAGYLNCVICNGNFPVFPVFENKAGASLICHPKKA